MTVEMLVRKVMPYWPQIHRYAIWAKTGGRCFYCGTQLIFGRMHVAIDSGLQELSEKELGARFMAIDHGTPFDRGGSGFLDDVFPACRNCNAQKGNKTVAEYRAWLLERGITPRFIDPPRRPDTSKHDYLLVGTGHGIVAEVEASDADSRRRQAEFRAKGWIP